MNAIATLYDFVSAAKYLDTKSGDLHYCSECVFLFDQHVEFMVKVVGVGYKPVVGRLLKTSCSYFLCWEERLGTVEITFFSCFLK